MIQVRSWFLYKPSIRRLTKRRILAFLSSPYFALNASRGTHMANQKIGRGFWDCAVKRQHSQIEQSRGSWQVASRPPARSWRTHPTPSLAELLTPAPAPSAPQLQESNFSRFPVSPCCQDNTAGRKQKQSRESAAPPMLSETTGGWQRKEPKTVGTTPRSSES